jgi:hypothetical protein
MVAATVGERYRHLKTGGTYHVIACARVEATLEWVVVYRGEDGEAWTRPIKEFCDGRFAKIEQ